MSASERLRELHVRYETPFHEYGPGFGPAEEYGTVVKRALPLIADVVEAAEEAQAKIRHVEVVGTQSWDSLAASVTALREALEEK